MPNPPSSSLPHSPPLQPRRRRAPATSSLRHRNAALPRGSGGRAAPRGGCRGDVVGAAGHQLRPGGQQPAATDRRAADALVARSWPRQALRRRPGHPPRVRQHRGGARGRRPRRVPRRRLHPRRRHVVGPLRRPAGAPGDQDRGAHRRQRGAHRRQQLLAVALAAPGHAVPPRRARAARPGQAGRRHHRAQPRRARHLLPALVGVLQEGPPPAALPDPRLPRPHRLALPRQRLPLLRLRRGPHRRRARLRAAGPGLRRRRRPLLRPALPKPARRAGGRRVPRHRGGQHCGGAGRRGAGVRDRVAVRRRRQRDRRDAAERRQVQRQRDAPRRRREGHAAPADGGAARLHVRALQREHEARPDVGAQLRPLQARRHAGLRALLPPAKGQHQLRRRRHGWRRQRHHYRRRLGGRRLLQHLCISKVTCGLVDMVDTSSSSSMCGCPDDDDGIVILSRWMDGRMDGRKPLVSNGVRGGTLGALLLAVAAVDKGIDGSECHALV